MLVRVVLPKPAQVQVEQEEEEVDEHGEASDEGETAGVPAVPATVVAGVEHRPGQHVEEGGEEGYEHHNLDIPVLDVAEFVAYHCLYLAGVELS